MRQDLWTDERTALVMKFYAEGLSASAIAGRIGGGLTRNAVIGRIHRMQRAAGHVPAARPVATKPKTKPTPKAKPSLPKLALVAPMPVVVEAAQGERRGLQVADLEPHHCRWPLGDPMSADFHFCGNERRDDKNPPYCAFHARLASWKVEGAPVKTDWTPQQKRDHRKILLAGLK